MRHAISTAVLLAVLGLGVTRAVAGEPTPDQLHAAAQAAGTVNGLCPVMNRPVTPQGGSVDYRGERIGFCCPGCIAKFQADPVRYMDAMRVDPATYGYRSQKPGLGTLRRAKAAAESANGLCPVMQNPVTADGGSATYRGQKIAFCCKGCIAQFEADPERFMRAMRADPLAYAYDRPGPTNAELRAAREAAGSVNGLCPVMGNLVKPAGGSVTWHGETIAFCCPGCVQKFKASPEAYMQKIRAEPAVYGYVHPAAPGAGSQDGH